MPGTEGRIRINPARGASIPPSSFSSFICTLRVIIIIKIVIRVCGMMWFSRSTGIHSVGSLLLLRVYGCIRSVFKDELRKGEMDLILSRDSVMWGWRDLYIYNHDKCSAVTYLCPCTAFDRNSTPSLEMYIFIIYSVRQIGDQKQYFKQIAGSVSIVLVK